MLSFSFKKITISYRNGNQKVVWIYSSSVFYSTETIRNKKSNNSDKLYQDCWTIYRKLLDFL